MSNYTFNTPILLIIFNRPDLTQQVLSSIAQLQPPTLFVAGDGPRKNSKEDIAKCTETRDIVSKGVTWPCKVVTLYQKENLGCKKAVSTAIDWFFDNVEYGIILEDDCLPDQSFFHYCQTLLNHYKENPQVMMVSGTNIAGVWKPEKDYHFSYYGGIWGWATWKRAWQKYDVTMNDWSKPEIRRSIKKLLGAKQYGARKHKYEKVFRGEVDTWDYQWSFARLANQGISIIPSKNLISNIGFRDDATHTKKTNDPLSNLVRHSLPYPIKLRSTINVDRQYDSFFFKKTHSQKSLLKRIVEKIKNQ